jgi:hypothetical protein
MYLCALAMGALLTLAVQIQFDAPKACAAESQWGYAPKFGDQTGTNFFTWSTTNCTPWMYINGSNYLGMVSTNIQFSRLGTTNTLIVRNGQIVDML